MSEKPNIHKAAFIVGLSSWLLLMGLNSRLFGLWEYGGLSIPFPIKGLMLNIFLASSFYYLNRVFRRNKNIEDFSVYLWRVFAMALVCAAFSLSLFLVRELLEYRLYRGDYIVMTVFFHIDFGLAVILMLTTFIHWKGLILYRSSERTRKIWGIFEYGLLTASVLHFFNISPNGIVPVTITVIFSLIGLYLSFNVKWVPYVNSTHKARDIMLLLSVVAVQFYFFKEFLDYNTFAADFETGVRKSLTADAHLIADSFQQIAGKSRSAFFRTLYFFSACYAIVGLLVMVFNLPTASVFEKKIRDLAGFKELSEVILEGKDELEVYRVLLKSSLETLRGDAAWLEIYNKEKHFVALNIDENHARQISKVLNESGFDKMKAKRFTPKTLLENIQPNTFESLVCIPLVSKEKHLGTLVLLKREERAFDGVTMNTVNTFAAQASLSLLNLSLISDAVETERYREELKIAHKVQESLLPNFIEATEDFDVYVHTGSAAEVGGDYYDYFKIDDEKYILIIGDVAGHGTSAAFNMAQMKGVFHSLVRFDLSPDLFFKYANDALSACLEKNLFITCSYFAINAKERKVYFARAGHCPTLFYTAKNGEANFDQSRGLGLGIVRSEKYANYVNINIFEYEEGDMMMLYTDGITEAKSKDSNEEFGFDRLKVFLEKNNEKPLYEITEGLIEDVFEFAGTRNLNDDYTLLLVRFR